ncbi:MAG: phage portal protein [Pedobacter sp.]|uniref:phage portal protein n=1 Tax=Pedobacter sp. TaxID=1411316 RepID=UPI003563DD8F
MNWLKRIFKRTVQKPIRKRSFAGAQMSRLNASWLATGTSGDAEIRAGLKTLRDRARELSRNNSYVKKYLRMITINVLGAKGITFQSKIKLNSGESDEKVNDFLEAKWADWGKLKNSPDVQGKLSWQDIQRQAIKTVARDGEVFIRIVRGYENKYRFALQLMESDHINENLNITIPNDNEIRMGVEFDKWKKPVAYHILTKHPGDYGGVEYRTERVLANDIIHLFDPDRCNDSRGFTWIHAGMATCQMLDGYEEAELVSARVSAAKMGIITTPDGQYLGDDTQGKDIITEAEPGTFEVLPAGSGFEMFDPKHPQGNFAPFVKQMLRKMSSAWGVAYNSLASDLESVNYASSRSGLLEERDNWRSIQNWFIENFCDIVYREWLEILLTLPGTPFSIRDLERFDSAKWTARTWDWVDPLKDQKANIEAVTNGLASYTDILAEQGIDFEEHIAELAYEKEQFADKGLDYPSKKVTAGNPQNIEKAEEKK